MQKTLISTLIFVLSTSAFGAVAPGAVAPTSGARSSGAVAPTSGARSSGAVAPTSGARSSGAVVPASGAKSSGAAPKSGIVSGLKTLGAALRAVK